MMFDLASRRVMKPAVQTGSQSRIGMHRFNADTLFLAVK